MKAPVIYRDMTDEDRELITALAKCRFPGACFSSRFATTLKARMECSGTISDRQAERLRVQAYIYRRQMPPHLVPNDPPAGYQTPAQRAAEIQPAPVPTIETEKAREILAELFPEFCTP